MYTFPDLGAVISMNIDQDSIVGFICVIVLLIMLNYPTGSLIVIMLVDQLLTRGNDGAGELIPFLASAFVGCIAKIFFTYMAGVILDTIDVLFVCFAIDKDNGVDLNNSPMSAIVQAIPGYILVPVGDVEMVAGGPAPGLTSAKVAPMAVSVVPMTQEQMQMQMNQMQPGAQQPGTQQPGAQQPMQMMQMQPGAQQPMEMMQMQPGAQQTGMYVPPEPVPIVKQL
jgi:hypothetical protein